LCLGLSRGENSAGGAGPARFGKSEEQGLGHRRAASEGAGVRLFFAAGGRTNRALLRFTVSRGLGEPGWKILAKGTEEFRILGLLPEKGPSNNREPQNLGRGNMRCNQIVGRGANMQNFSLPKSAPAGQRRPILLKRGCPPRSI